MEYRELLDQFTEAAKEAFREELVGVYLHGSAAMGCFRPERSDLDLLLVVEGEIADGAKLAFLERAVELNAEAPAKGLEFSVVRRAVCKPFVYPTPFELHFSIAHLESYRRDPVRYVEQMRGTDQDLAAHFTVINACGVVLYGADIPSVFGPVPRADYLDSIWSDIKDACQEITRDPVYYTLNLCRVLAQAEEGLVLSKASGGEWGLRRMPEAYQPVVEAALRSYKSGRPVELSAETLAGFAKYALAEIQASR